MATRVNTRFVLILTVTVLGAVGVIGGLWVLHLRADTTRHIKAGDALMAEAGEAAARGDLEAANAAYEQALKQYGRAAGKEPAEIGHLRKMESALFSIRPVTRDRAQELDDMRVSILRHETRYRPQDADVHLKLLRALHDRARWFGAASYWGALTEAAETMRDALSLGDPKRDYARLYRGIGRMRTMGYGGSTVPARAAAGEEISEAEEDLVAFVEAVPDSDLGWAALLQSRLSIARQAQVEGDTATADERFREIGEDLRRALSAVPEGPETARAVALCLVAMRQRAPESVEPGRLREAADRMVETLEGSSEPILAIEAAAILPAVDPDDGRRRATELLREHAGEGEHTYRLRYLLASRLYQQRELDEAARAAREVVEAEPPPVGIMSRTLPFLRARAATLIVDIEYLRWEGAAEDEQAAALARVEAARDRLAELVTEPDKDPALLRVDGKIALAKGDFAGAAAKLENALKRGSVEEAETRFETLWLSFKALEEIGQTGLATERLAEALALRPNAFRVLAEKARLEYRTGRYADAARTLERARELDPDHAAVRRLEIALQAAQTSRPEQAEDPAAAAILAANEVAEEGDLDMARSILTRALEEEPDALALLSQLVRVELRAGNIDAARRYLDRATELAPDNRFLHRLAVSLSNEDQIEALKQYVAGVYESEEDRAVQTFIRLQVLARQLENTAERRLEEGDEDLAAQTRQRAEEATREAERYRERIREIAPDHPALIDHLFDLALADGDLEALASLAGRARRADADRAGGLIFQGRYEMARGDHEEAVRTLTEATARKDYSSLAWRLLGRSHERLGNFTAALDAYERAYRCNPNDRYAVRWYVSLLVQTGDRERALDVARAARHTLPQDQVLRETWLELEADVGDLMTALDERLAEYRRNPEDRINAIRLVALLAYSEPGREHIRDDDDEVRYAADAWRALSEAERGELLAQLKTQWIGESERILGELEASGAEGVELPQLRAALLRRRGEIEAGEQVLRDYCERHPEDPAGLIALGRYQAEVRRMEDAIRSFELARAYQDPEIRGADVALADIYFNNRQWGRAARLYESLAEDGGTRSVKLRLVECRTRLGQYAEAEAVLDELVEDEGHDYFTSMLEADILQGQVALLREQGRDDEAGIKDAQMLDALDRAEAFVPSNPLPHVRRAQRLLAEHRRTGDMTHLDDALLALERADSARAGAEATRRVRVEILQLKGDERGAIGELSRLLDDNPHHRAARERLVQLLVGRREYRRALEVIDEAIELTPTLAVWHEARGDLQVLRGEYVEASAAFHEAHRLEPTTTRLAKFGELALRSDNPPYGELIQLIEASDYLLEGSPSLRAIYARALAGDGRREAALEQMRLAYEGHRRAAAGRPADPDELAGWFRSLQLVLADEPTTELERFVRETAGGEPSAADLNWLARSWFGTGPEGVSRAIELLRVAWQKSADDAVALRVRIALDLGQFEAARANFEAAAQAFEDALAQDPDHPLALNNAAYVYTEHLDQPEKGARYAERAAEAKPDDPHVLDTLGWARFKLGRHEEAENALRRSIELRPSAESHLHLAHVLYEMERLDEAIRQLRRAGELGPDDGLRERIDRLTREIADQIRQGRP